MNWDLDLLERVRTRRSAPRPTGYCIIAASVSTCTSATPACSTSARPAFAAVGRVRVRASRSSPTAGPWYWALPVMLVGSVLLALGARRADAATARRLPRHRHHRRRRDHQAVPRLDHASRGSPVGPTAATAWPTSSRN